MEIQIPSLLRIKPNALYKVGKYLRKNGFHRVAVVYGDGIRDLVGQSLDISLDSSEIRVVTEETVTSNEVEAVVAAAFRLSRDTEAIVAVGGGVAIDYGKYMGFLTRLPVIAVPTAVSNDGFGSPGASLVVDGRKTSCRASIPYGVVIDTTIIARSPAHLTLSGIGDLLSKYSAVADWKRSYHATGEAVNDFAVMIALQSVENVVLHPHTSLQDDEFLQLVCGALVMSGVAMEVSGSSRPASGSEHLISHAYDRLASTRSLHGVQVGVACVATMWAQGNPHRDTVLRVLDETGFHAWVVANPLEREAFVAAVRAAPSVRPGYHTVLSEPDMDDRLVEHLRDDPYYVDVLV
jgi:glycerol-1-phosphate dehydrogenase [NAD(P)+]